MQGSRRCCAHRCAGRPPISGRYPTGPGPNAYDDRGFSGATMDLGPDQYRGVAGDDDAAMGGQISDACS
jgi:hypothetical protein